MISLLSYNFPSVELYSGIRPISSVFSIVTIGNNLLPALSLQYLLAQEGVGAGRCLCFCWGLLHAEISIDCRPWESVVEQRPQTVCALKTKCFSLTAILQVYVCITCCYQTDIELTLFLWNFFFVKYIVIHRNSTWSDSHLITSVAIICASFDEMCIFNLVRNARLHDSNKYSTEGWVFLVWLSAMSGIISRVVSVGVWQG